MAGIAADVPRAHLPAAALRLMGDDRLVRYAAAGDTRAFELIYERHHQALYRYCRSVVGNEHDAADALQSTMASALRGLAGESRQIALKPWLFRIAHNECISLLRKRRPHVKIDEALGLEAPDHDPGLKERLRELVADLRELPDGQRGALVMHELSGLPYRDIAAALDTTEPHARQLVYEARTALHDLAQGRAMACEDVRRAISDGDGRVLRGRRMRAHLRACDGCQSFNELLRSRRRDLAMLAPPIPAVAAIGLLHKVLGGNAGGASAAAATSATGGGLGSLVAGKAVAGSLVAKAATVLAVAAAAGAGAVEVATSGHGANRTEPPPAVNSHGGASTGKPGSRHAPAGARHSSGSGAAGSRHAGAGGGAASTRGKSAFGHSRVRGHGRASHPAHPAHPVNGGKALGKTGHPARPARPEHSPSAPASKAPRSTATPPRSGRSPASSKPPTAGVNKLGSTLEDAGTSAESLPSSGVGGLHKGAGAAPTG